MLWAGFHCWPGNWDPTSHVVWETKFKNTSGQVLWQTPRGSPFKALTQTIKHQGWGAGGGGAALAQPWGSNYPANKAVGVTLLRQVEWLLSRYLTRQRVGVHGPGEAHWGANGPWLSLYFSVCRAQEEQVEAGGAQGRRPMVVICPQTSKAPHTPLTVLCLPGKGRSLPSVARQHGRGQGTHSSKPAAPPQALWAGR